MGFIPQITCRRCGSKFSTLRRRCPNCGTRRVQQSSRVPGTTPSAVKGTAASEKVMENRKWQLIFGAILVAAVIIALIVMITVSLKGAETANTPPLPSEIPVESTPTPTVTPTPTPVVTPTVSQVSINYVSSPVTDFTLKMSEGSIQLTASVYPTNISLDEVVWASSDESIVTVSNTGLVTAVGPGTATITLTCYGASAQCTVHIRNA